MRILFLALDVNMTGKTGDSTHVRELTASFSNTGNIVALVGYAPQETQHEVAELAEDMDAFVFIPKDRGNLATLRFCSKLAREFRPEAIYERRFSPKISVTLGKMTRTPSVVEINGMIEEEKKLYDKKEKSASGLDRIKRHVRRYFLTSANGIVAVSNGIRKALIEDYKVPPSKVRVVHNGANIDLFRPMDKSKCIEKLGLDSNLRYISFSGNLAPWQGVEYLISAFPKLIEDSPDLRLLLVGDGVLRADLERMVEQLGIQDHTSFTGRVPYEQVPLYMNSSEVCVAPFSGILRNVKYGFSAIKLYEYMGCGRPFVTTTVCGIQDEIEEHDIGVVVPPDDPDALADAISGLLGEEERARDM
ncbi:MAG: glycosyltransferase family 4 protein, partial [Thermoplasmata archaeon]|nr:glycosyltransferase family 4 protein [Thermoplasmata archaeon]